MDRTEVWIPVPDQAYLKGFVLDPTIDDETGTISVSFKDSGKTTRVKPDAVHLVAPADQDGMPDNCSLMYLKEPNLLHNLRVRYLRDDIYTYTAYILIAVNPYKKVDLYQQETMISYRNKSIGLMPPHVFAVADRAYRSMKSTNVNQSVIVSGESGAGKTETCKYVMRFLAAVGGDTSLGGVIENRIVEVNPIMEAFGNAKTTRNDNSSRFGKFTEIHFNDRATVVGTSICTYLLEKSRIIYQSPNERNYHIFYQLASGASDEERRKFSLGQPLDYFYLNQGGAMTIKDVDDTTTFRNLKRSFELIGVTAEEVQNIMQVVAAVLHLGNVTMAGNRNGDATNVTNETALNTAAGLLGVNPATLAERLTNKWVSIKREGRAYNVPLKERQAIYTRDALAKAAYSRLFDWLVERLNRSLPYTSSSTFIGVLDIAGFEFFENNSFEQFTINFANEKLQQHFNNQILNQEQEIYRKEGLAVKKIEYKDNQDCIDLIEKTGTGILSILDEECRLPDPKDGSFGLRVNKTHDGNPRILNPMTTKRPGKKKVTNEEAFIIRHFAGDVCYNTEGFLDKNSDPLQEALELVMAKSTNPFVAMLFAVPEEPEQEETSEGRRGSGVKKRPTVGGKFKHQLAELMARLESTQSNFIRCIKPNMEKVPGVYDMANILEQLRCSGMMEALQLMQNGFPTRCSFDDLTQRYKHRMPPIIAEMDPATFCEALLFALDLDQRDFQFGLTKVFFRAGKMAVLDKLTASDERSIEEIVEKVKKWLVRRKMRRVFRAVKSTCILWVYIKRLRLLGRLYSATWVMMGFTHLIKRSRKLQTNRLAARAVAKWRMRVDRRKFLELRKAAIVFQKYIRRYLVYNKYKKPRADLKAARLLRIKLEREAEELRQRLAKEAEERRIAEELRKKREEEERQAAIKRQLELEAKESAMAARLMDAQKKFEEEKAAWQKETAALKKQQEDEKAALTKKKDGEMAQYKALMEQALADEKAHSQATLDQQNVTRDREMAEYVNQRDTEARQAALVRDNQEKQAIAARDATHAERMEAAKRVHREELEKVDATRAATRHQLEESLDTEHQMILEFEEFRGSMEFVYDTAKASLKPILKALMDMVSRNAHIHGQAYRANKEKLRALDAAALSNAHLIGHVAPANAPHSLALPNGNHAAAPVPVARHSGLPPPAASPATDGGEGTGIDANDLPPPPEEFRD